MKSTSVLATIAISGFVAITPIVLPIVDPAIFQASAQEMGQDKIAQQDKLALVLSHKGKPESAVDMRKLYKDLTPIGIQPGGAGMVVNLYSKAEDTTLSLCTTFDVVVAAKKGKIAKFPPAEVK
jgi:hypothetical protein